MSDHREELRVDAALDAAVQACERAMPPLQRGSPWERTARRARATLKEELLVLARLLANPATVEIEVADDGDAVLITIEGRNLGWGPIQGRHVSGIVTDLAGRIRHEVDAGTVDATGAGESGLPTVPGERVAAPARQPVKAAGARNNAPGSWGVGRIFVSYRRDDTGYVTDALCNQLAEAFGRDAIFKDIDSIPPGVDFRQYLTDAIQKCDVLLAVVGRDWLEPGADGKTPRLHDAGDFVRIEIEAALARNIPVIPVLVRVKKLPEEAQLPESLNKFAYLNWLQVRREPDFGGDVERLRNRLAQILESATKMPETGRKPT